MYFPIIHTYNKSIENKYIRMIIFPGLWWGKQYDKKMEIQETL